MRVYKYRGGDKKTLKRDLKSLINNEIFSSPIESLNDIFESTCIVSEDDESNYIFKNLFGEKNLNEIKKHSLSLVKTFVSDTKKYGIYSLSKNYSDELLWAYYANSHQGFCIEYDIEELIKYELEENKIIDVRYSNNVPHITINEMLQLLGNKEKQNELIQKTIATKSKRWEHEQEIRIVTGQPGLYNYNRKSLKSIYFGFKCDLSFISLVMRTLRGRNLNYYKMNMIKNTYTLVREELVDMYINRPLPPIKAAEIEEGLPFIYDEYKNYTHYLTRAIEIVKYYPDSKKITDVMVIFNESNNDSPKICVIYICNKNKFRKKYFTLAELTE